MVKQSLRVMLLLGIGILIGITLRTNHRSPEVKRSSDALTIEQVKELSTLLTRRIEIADVSVTRLDGELGAVEAALLVRGHVDLGVDLDKAQLTEIDDSTKSAILWLPQPVVSSASLDHSRTRIVALNYEGVWKLNPQPGPARHVLERALASAQDEFNRVGTDETQRSEARQQIELVVASWSRPIGWKIRVEWR